MKRQFIFIAAFLCLLIIIGCGKPPMEKGDEAFNQQKYSEALKYYLEAVKEMPDNDVLKEKIATTYFKQGEIFWEKRRILRGIEARVNSGLSYVPDNPTPEMNKTISETYLTLALAYKNVKAENPFQKRQFFNKALESLEKSLSYDSTNTEANNTLTQFKEENFQEMLDKGIAAYRRGGRDRLQYITADYYLTNALKLDPDNNNAQRYLRLSRQKSLNLLDPGQDVPNAVTDQMENTEYAQRGSSVRHPLVESLLRNHAYPSSQLLHTHDCQILLNSHSWRYNACWEYVIYPSYPPVSAHQCRGNLPCLHASVLSLYDCVHRYHPGICRTDLDV